jgi:hypothetical protein
MYIGMMAGIQFLGIAVNVFSPVSRFAVGSISPPTRFYWEFFTNE